MLKISIPDSEFFDNESQTFLYLKGQDISLEHSLVSIAKWESKWNVPFLSDKTQKTKEMFLDYIRCMTITQNVNPYLYYKISNKDIEKIQEYINAPMTATWFNDDKARPRPSREVVTAEIVYYWMIALGIPMECQKWHFNRLITLVRVCSIKNTPDKKMSRKDWIAKRNAANAAYRRGIRKH